MANVGKKILIEIDDNNYTSFKVTNEVKNNDIIKSIVILFEYFDKETKQNILKHLQMLEKNEKDNIFFN